MFSVASLAGSVSEEELAAIVSGDLALPLGEMVAEDGMRFTLLPQDFDTENLETWLEYADESETITVLTGMPVVWDEIARLVLNAQATSLIVAYILVIVMLAISFR